MRVFPLLSQACVCFRPLESLLPTTDMSGESGQGGEGPLKDHRGRYLCRLCLGGPKRIDTKAEKRPWEGEYAHQACIKRVVRGGKGGKRPLPEEVAAETPMRLPAAPSQPRPATPTLLQVPAPSVAPSLDPSTGVLGAERATPASAADSVAPPAEVPPATSGQGPPSSFQELICHLQRYGWVRISSTVELRQLAWDLLQILNSPDTSGASGLIAGKVKQLDLEMVQGEPTRVFLRRWGQAVRGIAASLGIDASGMHVVTPKVLSSAPGDGAQTSHWDCARDNRAAHKYSLILTISNGHRGTALPVFEENAVLSFSHFRAEMQTVAHLLDPAYYFSEPTFPGDVIFFRQSTPHYGVRNDLKKGNRVVFFSILSPSLSPDQDDLQVFPWLYQGEAFGWNSREFAEALLAGKVYNPVGRIELDQGLKWKNVALNTLRKFDLLEEFLAK